MKPLVIPPLGLAMTTIERSLSFRQLLERWKIGPKKLREMLRRGVVEAIDFGVVGRTQYRFTPEAIRKCEERLAVRPAPARRRRADDGVSPTVRALLAGDD